MNRPKAGNAETVTSIIKVRDHEETLAIANATDYGLSSGPRGLRSPASAVLWFMTI
jgi:hypothetical protein